LQRALESGDLALSVDKPLLKSLDLITGMVRGEYGSEGGGIRRGVKETELISREESRCVVLFPISCRSNGMSRTEWIILVIAGGMGSGLGTVGSEGRSEFG
jgi:hypothetical protein